jgi:hypothetical protein
VGALDWRRAAARDLAHQVSLHKRLDDLQAALRHRREDAVRIGFDLPCADLEEAIDHLDSAILLIGSSRAHVEEK